MSPMAAAGVKRALVVCSCESVLASASLLGNGKRTLQSYGVGGQGGAAICEGLNPGSILPAQFGVEKKKSLHLSSERFVVSQNSRSSRSCEAHGQFLGQRVDQDLSRNKRSRMLCSLHACRCKASAEGSGRTATKAFGGGPERLYYQDEDVPTPLVHIDQHSEANATVVSFQFGERLEASLEMMKALKDLDLVVVKGTMSVEERGVNCFYVTKSEGGKVEDPEVLEQIRLVIINHLLQNHPESRDVLAMGVAKGQSKKHRVNPNIRTHIHVEADKDGERSLLFVETADRPGLLLEIIRVLDNIGIKVESAEINTEGFVAKDKFFVSYNGVTLSLPMEHLVRNGLHYYLTTGDIEYEESY